MKFNVTAATLLTVVILSPQPSLAQSWTFGALTIEDTSPSDPSPLYVYGGSTIINSTTATLLPPPSGFNPSLTDLHIVALKADIAASYENPFSIIYASTTRSAIIRQTCIYSADNIPPKTIKSTEGFLWEKSSESPAHTAISFGGFSPSENSGMLMISPEFNPAFSAHYVSSYALHYSSTFVLEGGISATAAVYGLGTNFTNPQSEAMRGWSCIEGDNVSDGSGI